MPKRVKNDETASRTMSIMPTAAFIRPASGTEPFQMRRFQQDSSARLIQRLPRRPEDAEIAHIKRMSTVGRKNDAH